MTMHLLIKTDNVELQEKYNAHTNYHPGDSGLDLFCPKDILVKSGETVKIDLEIQCEALKDNRNNVSYYLYPRSSIVKTPLRLANSVGIIDSGYRGEIMAVFDNVSNDPFALQHKQRLVQICSPDLSPFIVRLVSSENDLSNTSRAEGGLGSTGI